jgi:N-acetylglucosaminyl-diphospho-decaprenol L-rhamnosyltransferase
VQPAGRSARWAAVVVNYDSGPLLVRCVRSLVADTSAGGPPEVVVVSNSSRDGSAEAVEAEVPEVAVLRPGANLGYGRAANLGIAATRAPVVAVVNPDAELAPGGAAVILERFASERDLAAVGPRIRNPDGTTYPSARRSPSAVDALGHALLERVAPGNRFTRRYRQLDADPDRARDVDWVSGAAVWLRREALDGVGGWDERYFMFLEDVDLGRSLVTQGWRIAYEPRAEVVHAVGTSRAGRRFRSVVAHHRAAYQFAAKWWRGPRRLLLPVAAGFLALRAAVLVLAAAAGRARPGAPG